MDFDAAVTGHSQWKMKLRRYLAHPDASLDADSLSSDSQCALGKWLYGEGAALKGTAEYAKLRSDHAQFHQAAAEVVRKAQRGVRVTEEVALGGTSAFSRSSMAVVTAILAMKDRAAKRA